MPQIYIRKKVEEITGIPARRIQFYTDSGLISLEDRHTGRGRERKYTKRNLLELLIIKELSRLKVELSQIRWIVSEAPKKVDPEYFDVERILTSKGGYYLFVYEDGIPFYSRQKDRVSLKRSDKVDLDMRNHSSAIVINVSYLAEKLAEV